MWGRVRRNFESSRADAQASLAEFYNVLLTLQFRCRAKLFLAALARCGNRHRRRHGGFAPRTGAARARTVLKAASAAIWKSRRRDRIGHDRSRSGIARTTARPVGKCHRDSRRPESRDVQLAAFTKRTGIRSRRKSPPVCRLICWNAVPTWPSRTSTGVGQRQDRRRQSRVFPGGHPDRFGRLFER